MKTKTKVVCALALLGLAWWAWPERDKRPEDQLVAHMDATCAIAKKNVATPRAGVDELFAYLGEHTPAVMQQFGALLVAIERIPDDDAHDERARRAARRLHAAGKRCERHWEQFFAAVERDPVARQRFERGVERLGRTLEILFGANAGQEAPRLPPWREALTGAL